MTKAAKLDNTISSTFLGRVFVKRFFFVLISSDESFNGSSVGGGKSVAFCIV